MHPRQGIRCAFTLIEVMIVVAMMAIVLAIGIPSIARSLREDSMRKTVREIVEVCSHARARAILGGQSMDLYIRPLEGTFEVRISADASARAGVLADPAVGAEDPPESEESKVPSVKIPRSIQIEIMGVNFQDVTESEEARVRFHPNGTCDEFTMILRSDQNEWRKITLELVTGLADVEKIR